MKKKSHLVVKELKQKKACVKNLTYIKQKIKTNRKKNQFTMESKQMINIFVIIAAVSCFMAVQVQGYTAIFPPAQHASNPDKCFDEQMGVFYEVGTENNRPNQCERIFCFKDFSMVLHGCGLVAAGPGCEVVQGDLNKPYPFCCETVKCAPIVDDEGIYENTI